MSKTVTFESSLKELEDIVQQLEQGELSLDDSLKTYERGVRIAKQCQKTLTEAELKIKTISGVEESGSDE